MYLNKKVFLSVVLLVIIGIFAFFSVSLTFLKDPLEFNKVFLIQIGAIIIGFILMYFIYKNKNINAQSIRNYSLYFFVVSVIVQFLVFVPGIGHSIGESSRWISLSFITIQPSVILRFFSVLFIANIFYILNSKIREPKVFITLILIFILPIISLYYIISDMGSLMILLFVIFGMLFFTKIDKIKLILISFVSLITMVTLI